MKCPEHKVEMREVLTLYTVYVKGYRVDVPHTVFECPVCGFRAATIEQTGNFQKKILDKMFENL